LGGGSPVHKEKLTRSPRQVSSTIQGYLNLGTQKGRKAEGVVLVHNLYRLVPGEKRGNRKRTKLEGASENSLREKEGDVSLKLPSIIKIQSMREKEKSKKEGEKKKRKKGGRFIYGSERRKFQFRFQEIGRRSQPENYHEKRIANPKERSIATAIPSREPSYWGEGTE